MSALVLDAGALIAVDRNDRATVALFKAAQVSGLSLRTNSNIVAQAWRDDRGRQAHLARFLRSVDIGSIDAAVGREAGLLLGESATNDVVDATIVLVAKRGDRIVTSDPEDIANLIAARGELVGIIEC